MKLLLTNVVWDNTYKETRYFENVNVRNEWFNLPDSLDDRPNVNFNVRGDLLASCVISIGGSNLVRMNYNYLVVHDEANSDYLFYFINSCNYLNGGQIQYNLELDVITTYLPTISALPSHMYSAHIDRFKKSTDQVIHFDTSYQSKLWLEDIPNLAKRLKYKVPIKWKITGDETVDTWLHDNVLCWVNVYMKSNQMYYYADGEHTPETPTQRKVGQSHYCESVDDLYFYVNEETPNPDDLRDYSNVVPSKFIVLSVPIYKTDKRIFVSNTSTLDAYNLDWVVDMSALTSFIGLNSDDAYTYSYNVTSVPPLYSLRTNNVVEKTYTIENDDLHINTTFSSLLYTGFFTMENDPYGLYYNGALMIQEYIQLDALSSYPIYVSQIGYITSFDRDFIRGFNYDDFLPEPKLSKMSVKELQLTSSFGSNFTFDGLKLLNEDQSISFNLYEPLMVGTMASLVRPVFNNDDDSVYQTSYNNEIIGLVSNFDSTLPFAINQLDNFLANNKNFFMQRNLEYGISIGKSAINTMGTYNFDTLQKIGGGILDLYKQVTNTQLSIDNMRNAPSTYKDTSSSIFMQLGILTDFGYYVEVWDALDIDKKIYLDNINHFGYVLNIEDDMAKYFHTRKYFNYVRGDIHSISNNLSNVVKNKIKSIFNNGIRLFHRDNFEDPVTQNYELSLED